MSQKGSGATAVLFGGSGFIGTYLARALKGTGEFSRIVVADVRPPATAVPGIEYFSVDVRQPIELPGTFEHAEVYNLAAVHTTPGHEDWEYFWTNVSGATNICRFAGAIDARFLLFTSSISVYGPTEEPRGEDDPLTPDSAYGRSKLLAENIHRGWKDDGDGRRLAIVRPAVIFGPGEGGNFTRLAKMLKSGFFAYPARRDTVKACAYVGELVRSILFMRGRQEKEITYNLAYPERTTSEQICTAMCRVQNYRPTLVTAPLWAMLVAGGTFELLRVFGKKTSINRARVRKLVNSTNIVPKRLLAMNYAFATDLESGLKQWRQESTNGDFL